MRAAHALVLNTASYETARTGDLRRDLASHPTIHGLLFARHLPPSIAHKPTSQTVTHSRAGCRRRVAPQRLRRARCRCLIRQLSFSVLIRRARGCSRQDTQVRTPRRAQIQSRLKSQAGWPPWAGTVGRPPWAAHVTCGGQLSSAGDGSCSRSSVTRIPLLFAVLTAPKSRTAAEQSRSHAPRSRPGPPGPAARRQCPGSRPHAGGGVQWDALWAAGPCGRRRPALNEPALDAAPVPRPLCPLLAALLEQEEPAASPVTTASPDATPATASPAAAAPAGATPAAAPATPAPAGLNATDPASWIDPAGKPNEVRQLPYTQAAASTC